MNTRQSPPRSYVKFDPSFKWTKDDDDDSETLVLFLPGFKKEHVKVQMDNFGNLKVSGECPLTSDQWSIFRKDFRIPKYTSTADIRAKIEDGNLYIKFPKLSAKSPKIERGTKANGQTAQLTEPDRPTGRITSAQNQGGVQNNTNKSELSNRKTSEDIGALNNARKIHEEKMASVGRDDKTRIGESRIGKKENEKESENIRKRKYEEGSGVGMKLMKKQRQLMVNVGVAFVMLVGLTFYVSYKLKKHIEKEGN